MVRMGVRPNWIQLRFQISLGGITLFRRSSFPCLQVGICWSCIKGRKVTGWWMGFRSIYMYVYISKGYLADGERVAQCSIVGSYNMCTTCLTSTTSCLLVQSIELQI